MLDCLGKILLGTLEIAVKIVIVVIAGVLYLVVMGVLYLIGFTCGGVRGGSMAAEW